MLCIQFAVLDSLARGSFINAFGYSKQTELRLDSLLYMVTSVLFMTANNAHNTLGLLLDLYTSIRSLQDMSL